MQTSLACGRQSPRALAARSERAQQIGKEAGGDALQRDSGQALREDSGQAGATEEKSRERKERSELRHYNGKEEYRAYRAIRAEQCLAPTRERSATALAYKS